MVDDDETNFRQKLLLTNRQVQNLRKAFSKKSLTDRKLLKTKLTKMVQSGGFLYRLSCSISKNTINFNKKCN